MTNFATLNGQRAISARVTIPAQGTWSADVILAADATIDGSVTLVIGDLTMKGTTIRTGSFSGSRSARIVGGGGGWRKDLPPKGYNNPSGVKASNILQDAARESGETMGDFTDATLGNYWFRDAGPAEHSLAFIVPNWWMGLDGKTNGSARASAPIATPFTIEKWSGGRGLFHVATETLSDWMPGRSFTAPTVSQTQTISQTSIELDNEGKLRLTVLNGGTIANRVLDDIRNIIDEELQDYRFSAYWEYVVTQSAEGAIDARPAEANSPMPPVASIPPLFGTSIGMTPAVGESVTVVFLDKNPAKPRWFAPQDASLIRLLAGGQSGTEHVLTVEALVVFMHNFLVQLSLSSLGAMAIPGAIVTLLNTVLAACAIPAPPTLVAQLALAPTIASNMLSNFPPTNMGNVVTPYLPALAALGTKTPDVSGQFPGLGSPSVKV